MFSGVCLSPKAFRILLFSFTVIPICQSALTESSSFSLGLQITGKGRTGVPLLTTFWVWLFMASVS